MYVNTYIYIYTYHSYTYAHTEANKETPTLRVTSNMYGVPFYIRATNHFESPSGQLETSECFSGSPCSDPPQ